MRAWLRAPALHFVALGALAFALTSGLDAWQAARAGHGAPSAAVASDEELLEREARRRGLERGDSVIQRRLVRNLRFLEPTGRSDDEADFEEALALGLDRSDLVVRRRLVQRLELRALAWARASEPSDAELAALLARSPGRFALPTRVGFSHVFLSRDRHGAALEAADRALAPRLAALAPEQAAALGDPFLLGPQLTSRTQAQLAASFGVSFAEAVAALELGRWSGPIASSYGLHRVFVRERTPAREPELEQVRGAVREAVFAERAEAVLADWLRHLREPSA